MTLKQALRRVWSFLNAPIGPAPQRADQNSAQANSETRMSNLQQPKNPAPLGYAICAVIFVIAAFFIYQLFQLTKTHRDAAALHGLLIIGVFIGAFYLMVVVERAMQADDARAQAEWQQAQWREQQRQQEAHQRAVERERYLQQREADAIALQHEIAQAEQNRAQAARDLQAKQAEVARRNQQAADQLHAEIAELQQRQARRTPNA